jgi:hypothetical protein
MPAMFVLLRLKKLPGKFLESGETVLTATIISLPVILVLPCGASWVHSHSANWVGSHY